MGAVQYLLQFFLFFYLPYHNFLNLGLTLLRLTSTPFNSILQCGGCAVFATTFLFFFLPYHNFLNLGLTFLWLTSSPFIYILQFGDCAVLATSFFFFYSPHHNFGLTLSRLTTSPFISIKTGQSVIFCPLDRSQISK